MNEVDLLYYLKTLKIPDKLAHTAGFRCCYKHFCTRMCHFQTKKNSKIF